MKRKQFNSGSSEAELKPNAKRQIACCICGLNIPTNSFGWDMGNNAYPYGHLNNNRCCDECNWNIVIPTRIELTINNGEQ